MDFPDGEVMLLTANLIMQPMYAQCDVDRNKHILLECFIDIQKDSTAKSLDEQKAAQVVKSTCNVQP